MVIYNHLNVQRYFTGDTTMSLNFKSLEIGTSDSTLIGAPKLHSISNAGSASSQIRGGFLVVLTKLQSNYRNTRQEMIFTTPPWVYSSVSRVLFHVAKRFHSARCRTTLIY